MKKLFGYAFIVYSLFGSTAPICAQQAWNSSELTIARVKYRGGGDWYNDPSAIPNMLRFLSQNTSIHCAKEERYVELGDAALFTYPIIFMTGHGKISFSDREAKELRKYLTSGGFLYGDDDYGMDKFFRKAMSKVFPEKKLVEIPFNHPIFGSVYAFKNGAPKIHEHDGGPPKTFAIFHEGRLVVLYTANTNISDGWADANVHNNPPDIREKAFRFGANVIVYALTN